MDKLKKTVKRIPEGDDVKRRAENNNNSGGSEELISVVTSDDEEANSDMENIPSSPSSSPNPDSDANQQLVDMNSGSDDDPLFFPINELGAAVQTINETTPGVSEDELVLPVTPRKKKNSLVKRKGVVKPKCLDYTEQVVCENSGPMKNLVSEALEKCTKYALGSIVWAKLDGYPWWPGMIDKDPDTHECFSPHGFSEISSRYHVIFLDDPVTRAWIRASRIKPFTGHEDEDLQLKSKQHHTSNKSHQYDKKVEEAKKRAAEALKISTEERLKKYGFANRYDGGQWSDDDSNDGEEVTPECSYSTCLSANTFNDLGSDEIDMSNCDSIESSLEFTPKRKKKQSTNQNKLGDEAEKEKKNGSSLSHSDKKKTASKPVQSKTTSEAKSNKSAAPTDPKKAQKARKALVAFIDEDEDDSNSRDESDDTNPDEEDLEDAKCQKVPAKKHLAIKKDETKKKGQKNTSILEKGSGSLKIKPSFKPPLAKNKCKISSKDQEDGEDHGSKELTKISKGKSQNTKAPSSGNGSSNGSSESLRCMEE